MKKKSIALLLTAIVCLSLCACGGKPEQPVENPELSYDQMKEQIKQELIEEMKEGQVETKETIIPEGLIRPEVKEFLDTYENFMDEYIEFMKSYESSSAEDLVAMMGGYADLMAQYADYSAKLDALDEDSMNEAELAYYIEVTSRIEQKLLLATQ